MDATRLDIPRTRQQAPVLVEGVYFLFLEEALQYVGESVNVACRVAGHRREGRIPFDSWTFLPVDGDKEARRKVESAYILKYSPLCNRKPGSKQPRGPSSRVLKGRPAPSATWRKAEELSQRTGVSVSTLNLILSEAGHRVLP